MIYSYAKESSLLFFRTLVDTTNHIGSAPEHACDPLIMHAAFARTGYEIYDHFLVSPLNFDMVLSEWDYSSNIIT